MDKTKEDILLKITCSQYRKFGKITIIPDTEMLYLLLDFDKYYLNICENMGDEQVYKVRNKTYPETSEEYYVNQQFEYYDHPNISYLCMCGCDRNWHSNGEGGSPSPCELCKCNDYIYNIKKTLELLIWMKLN